MQSHALSLVFLGTTRFISYGDLKKAQEKRKERDAAEEAKSKGKRGRKCKSAPGADTSEAAPKRAKEVGPSEVIESEGIPVAKM